MKNAPSKLAVAFGVVALIGLGMVLLERNFFPTNEQDNRNPKKLKEMAVITLEWGRLAPFPTDARNFKIHTEGNMFTRTFKGSFDASREAIVAWLTASPGVKEGTAQSDAEGKFMAYVLQTQPKVSYRRVKVFSNGTHVEFEVSWS